MRPVVAGDVVTAVQRVCQSKTGAPDAFILYLIVGCEQVHNLDEGDAGRFGRPWA
ncbi:MAG: hypothetical protein M5U34_46555 [Chloroflexi bacterium]|nr:hypothetical protein [Chloroflexota bacterium]